MNRAAYEKKLFKEHKKFMESIKTSNDVWDKLLTDTTTIDASSLFYTISHLFSETKTNENQVAITISSTNRFNGITATKTLWIDPKQ